MNTRPYTINPDEEAILIFSVSEEEKRKEYTDGATVAAILAKGDDPRPGQVCQTQLCALRDTIDCPMHAPQGYCDRFTPPPVSVEELEKMLLETLAGT